MNKLITFVIPVLTAAFLTKRLFFNNPEKLTAEPLPVTLTSIINDENVINLPAPYTPPEMSQAEILKMLDWNLNITKEDFMQSEYYNSKTYTDSLLEYYKKDSLGEISPYKTLHPTKEEFMQTEYYNPKTYTDYELTLYEKHPGKDIISPILFYYINNIN